MDVQNKKKIVRVLMESLKEGTGQHVTICRHRNYVIDDFYYLQLSIRPQS